MTETLILDSAILRPAWGSALAAPFRSISRIALVLVWVLAAGTGLGILFSYQNRQAPRGTTPAIWPAGSGIPRNNGGATLLVFLHPNCPCSKASVHSLQRVAGRVPPGDLPRTVFVMRRAASADWRARNLAGEAALTPNATLFDDADEAEGRRFATRVSGHVLLYDRDGRLVFDGGLTAERGMEGESIAADRLLSLLTHTTAMPARTAVFGCALQTPTSNSENGKRAACPTS